VKRYLSLGETNLQGSGSIVRSNLRKDHVLRPLDTSK
jgi:hypothetical protein